jgi:uncharacterized protein YfaQ (DUF2300 family)
MPQEHVEEVVVLRHDQGADPKPCGKVAQRATVSWLDDVIEKEQPIQCSGCKKLVTLDDVSGDEPYTPTYRQPRATR